MDLLDPLGQSFDHTTKVLSAVSPEQLDAPTPCTEWPLRTLIGHVMGVVTNMGLAARGETLLPDLLSVPLEADVAGQFQSVAEGTLAGWRARGTDGTVDVGAGPMPVTLAMSINLVDTTTHSWDIARAAGQDATLPDDLAATALTVAQGFLNDQIRSFAGIDPAVALDGPASPTDQLVAFMGRRP
jgi:uncharacterized protein (TIGR03086 family)